MASLSPADIERMKQHPEDNKQPDLWAVIICAIILPPVFVFLRFLARYRIHSRPGADDYLILAALIPCIGMAVTNIFTVRGGLGKHIIYAKDLELFAKTFIAAEIFYAFSITLTKLSILCLYLRIFASKRLKILAIGVASVVVAYNLALVLVSLLQCIPLSKTWTPEKPGTCVKTSSAYLTLGIANVVTDIFILCLPVKYVFNLQMKLSRKIQIVGLFMLGGVVCIFGIIRCVVLEYVSAKDLTWTGAEGSLWSMAEMFVAAVCANFPVLRPLFVKDPLARSSTAHKSSSNSADTVKPHRNPIINRNLSVTVTSSPLPPSQTIQGREESYLLVESEPMGTQNMIWGARKGSDRTEQEDDFESGGGSVSGLKGGESVTVK